MEKNEIKKELYRNNPKAELKFIRKGVAYYESLLSNEQEISIKKQKAVDEKDTEV